jgi:hypothetical protein
VASAVQEFRRLEFNRHIAINHKESYFLCLIQNAVIRSPAATKDAPMTSCMCALHRNARTVMRRKCLIVPVRIAVTMQAVK